MADLGRTSCEDVGDAAAGFEAAPITAATAAASAAAGRGGEGDLADCRLVALRAENISFTRSLLRARARMISLPGGRVSDLFLQWNDSRISLLDGEIPSDVLGRGPDDSSAFAARTFFS